MKPTKRLIENETDETADWKVKRPAATSVKVKPSGPSVPAETPVIPGVYTYIPGIAGASDPASNLINHLILAFLSAVRDGSFAFLD